jgi:hypothetical protein
MPGTDTGMGIAIGNGLQSQPHGRVSLAANNTRGTVIVSDHRTAITGFDARQHIVAATVVKRHVQGRLVANDQRTDTWVSAQRGYKRGHYNARTKVPAHSVYGNSERICQERYQLVGIGLNNFATAVKTICSHMVTQVLFSAH